MRLLLAADIFPPESGGPATYVVTLANELSKQGANVCIVSLNPQSDEHAASCIMYHVSWSNKLMRYIQYFWLLLRKAKYADVVYAMGPVNAGLPALIAARLRGKKFVVKVVGDYAWEQSENQKLKIKDQNVRSVPIDEFQKIKIGGKVGWLKKVESFVVRQADQIVVPSQYLKRMLMGWGADEKNIAVIYNAIDVPRVWPKLKPAWEQWIVSVGRLVPWKGFGALIEMMKDMPANAKLKIIGDGPDVEYIKNQISNIKITDRIELLGNLPRSETLSYLAAADVFVLNSGYEGLSHAILEAMSVGTPVLASAVGGNPELVADENLFIYNNKEMIRKKIMHILSQPKQAHYRVPEQFSISQMVHSTKKLLMLT